MNWIEKLKSLHSCEDALEWAKQYPTAQAAWDACERGDWMLWYAARVGLTPERHRQIVRAACLCVRRVLHLIPEGELRPLQAVKAAERWADNPTEENAEAAAWAAAEAAWVAGAAAEAAAGAAAAAAAAGAAEAAWVEWVARAAWVAGVEWAAWVAGVEWVARAAAEAAMCFDGAAEYKAQADIIRSLLSCPA